MVRIMNDFDNDIVFPSPIKAVNETDCKSNGKKYKVETTMTPYIKLLWKILSSSFLFTVMRFSKISVQAYSLIILMLLKHSVVILILVSYFFIYDFYSCAL